MRRREVRHAAVLCRIRLPLEQDQKARYRTRGEARFLDMGNVKTAVGVAVVLLLVALFAWTIHEVWSRWGELRGVSPSPETTIFQTGAASIAWAFLLVAFGFLGIAAAAAVAIVILPSEIRNLLSEIWAWCRGRRYLGKTDLGEIAGALFATVGLLFLGGMCVWGGGYYQPLSENIAIDRSRQFISVERQYLLREEEGLQIPFDEITLITYHYTPGSPAVGGQGGTAPSGIVEVTKLDGKKVKISSDGPSAQRDLAKAIAGATGKPLRED